MPLRAAPGETKKTADGGSRTRNLRFTNPCDELYKPLEIKQLTNFAESAGKPGGKNFERENSVPDSRLAGILESWDSLPEPIRIGIWALVQASDHAVESRTSGL